MALHFEIKVNGVMVGWVYIRRLHDLKPGQPSEYTATVEYPLGKEHKTRVRHDYDDGALVLVAKTLAAVRVTP